jgi:hypothetical protein
MEDIPVDMKTQLNNLLAQKKKKKQIKKYTIVYKDVVLSKDLPQSRHSVCNINIILPDETSYQIELKGDTFGNKKDAERHVAYQCYNQIISDLDDIETYNQPICNFGAKGRFALNMPNIDALDEDEIVFSSSKVTSNINMNVDVDVNVNNWAKNAQIYPLLPIVAPKSRHSRYLYILCDIENKPNTTVIEDLVTKYDDMIVLKFVGHNHPNRGKGNIVVKSSYPDAADHAISMYVGGIIQSVTIPVDIIIYTGDKFASGLKEFCYFDNINVYHMAHSVDILEHIMKWNKN